ncbi:uncharacterized protein ISCGN_025864 [Ixodes scapularis]
MGMHPALAFLPIADIPEAFKELFEVFPTDALLVADHFENVHIGRHRRNGLSGGDPLVWSVRESTLAERPTRTNNSIEAWLRGLHYGAHSKSFLHECVCSFFFLSLKEMKLAQAEGGTTSSRVSKKHDDSNRRLQIIVSRYNGRNRPETLRVAARNIAF